MLGPSPADGMFAIRWPAQVQPTLCGDDTIMQQLEARDRKAVWDRSLREILRDALPNELRTGGFLLDARRGRGAVRVANRLEGPQRPE